MTTKLLKKKQKHTKQTQRIQNNTPYPETVVETGRQLGSGHAKPDVVAGRTGDERYAIATDAQIELGRGIKNQQSDFVLGVNKRLQSTKLRKPVARLCVK